MFTKSGTTRETAQLGSKVEALSEKHKALIQRYYKDDSRGPDKYVWNQHRAQHSRGQLVEFLYADWEEGSSKS